MFNNIGNLRDSFKRATKLLNNTTNSAYKAAQQINQNETLIRLKKSTLWATTSTSQAIQNSASILSQATYNTASTLGSTISNFVSDSSSSDDLSDEEDEEIEKITKPKTKDEKLIESYNEFVNKIVEISKTLDDSQNIALPNIDIYQSYSNYCEQYIAEIELHLNTFKNLLNLPARLKNIDEFIKNQEELEEHKKECEEKDKQKIQVTSENDNRSRSASQVTIHNNHTSANNEEMLQKFSEELVNTKFTVQSAQSLSAKISRQSSKSDTKSNKSIKSIESSNYSMHFSRFFKRSEKTPIDDRKEIDQRDNSSEKTILLEQKSSSRHNSQFSQNFSKSESTVTLKNDSSNLSLDTIDQLLKQIDENDERIQKAHELIEEIKSKKPSKTMRFLSIFACGVCKSKKSKFD